jgi:hypothetical protein
MLGYRSIPIPAGFAGVTDEGNGVGVMMPAGGMASIPGV